MSTVLLLVDEIIKYLLRINEQYSPLASKHYNFTYLSKLAMLPDDNTKIETVAAIASDGLRNALDTLDIERIPRLLQKRLVGLFSTLIKLHNS
jgi:hypothetical protein